MKLINAPTSLRDIFATNLDPKADGVPSWEQFGEKLLGMTATDLRQFKACESPTQAILNKKVATDPFATIEDALRALEAIGRKDVHELVLQNLESTPLAMLSKQESEERGPFGSSSSKPSLIHQSSSGSTISKQGSGDWESVYPSPHVQVTQRPPLLHQASSSDSGYGDTGGHMESNDTPTGPFSKSIVGPLAQHSRVAQAEFRPLQYSQRPDDSSTNVPKEHTPTLYANTSGNSASVPYSVQLQATQSPHVSQVPPGCSPAIHQATTSLPIPGTIFGDSVQVKCTQLD